MQLTNLRQRLYSLCLLIFLTTGCQPKEITYVKGSLNQAFAQAQKENKYLIVITTAGECPMCGILQEMFIRETKLKRIVANDFLVYKCDLNAIGNEYLFRATYSVASPTTYIFSPEGKLKDLLVGGRIAPEEVARVLEQAKGSEYEEKKYYSRLDLEGAELIDFLNKIITANKIYQSNTNDKVKLDEALQLLTQSFLSGEYFYNHYLSAKLYQKLDNKPQAVEHARVALSFNESFDLYLYQPLRNEMKFVADENYNSSKEPYLAFDKREFDFGLQSLKTRPKVVYTFKNTGKNPLIVYNAQGNCNCMDISWTKEPVPAGKEGKVEVVYHADHEGSFSKAIFVNTNAVNSQVLLTLKGIVNE